MPKLIVMNDRGATRLVALQTPETKIGRASVNDIVIDSERVSRFHAVVTLDGPFVSIKDLDSRNGTRVNGVVVQSQLLMDGDTIAIGGSQIRFLAGAQEVTTIDALSLASGPGQLLGIDPSAPPSPGLSAVG